MAATGTRPGGGVATTGRLTMRLADAVAIEAFVPGAATSAARGVRFFDGGAADELKLRHNRAVFEGCRLRLRVLVDVEHGSTSISGAHSSLPLAIAPSQPRWRRLW